MNPPPALPLLPRHIRVAVGLLIAAVHLGAWAASLVYALALGGASQALSVGHRAAIAVLGLPLALPACLLLRLAPGEWTALAVWLLIALSPLNSALWGWLTTRGLAQLRRPLEARPAA